MPVPSPSSGRDAAHAHAERTLRAGMDGDARAQRCFLQRLGVHLRSFHRRRLPGWPEDVEDLAQDTPCWRSTTGVTPTGATSR